MKSRIAISLLVLTFVAGFVGAQDLLVEYVDGVLEVREDNQWYELFIGESVAVGDHLRLAEGTFAEISADGITIKLSEPGTYDTESLVGQARRQNEADFGSLLATRLRSIGGSSRDTSRGTVGGVRGSEAVNQPNTMWVGGESVDDLIAEGMERLGEQDYQEAYWIFEEAFDYSDETSEARASFYLGYSAALIGETEESLSLLTAFEPDPAEDYYDDHALVLAQLLVQTFAYDRALDLIEDLKSDAELDDETRQLVLLLQGTSLQGLNRNREARQILGEAIDLDPASSVAGAARALLN